MSTGCGSPAGGGASITRPVIRPVSAASRARVARARERRGAAHDAVAADPELQRGPVPAELRAAPLTQRARDGALQHARVGQRHRRRTIAVRPGRPRGGLHQREGGGAGVARLQAGARQQTAQRVLRRVPPCTAAAPARGDAAGHQHGHAGGLRIGGKRGIQRLGRDVSSRPGSAARPGAGAHRPSAHRPSAARPSASRQASARAAPVACVTVITLRYLKGGDRVRNRARTREKRHGSGAA